MTDHTENDRRHVSDRRDGADRRERYDRRLIKDRNNARRLPDQFAQAAGGSEHRLKGLVNRYWPGYSEPERSELSQALLSVLEGLAAPGVPVTDAHREKCVEVVVDWAVRLEPV